MMIFATFIAMIQLGYCRTDASQRADIISSPIIFGNIKKAMLMSGNDQDFIARSASAAEKLHGLQPDDGKTIENFALCGLKRRAGLLESLDAELRGELDSSPNNLRRRVQLMELRRKMGGVHEALHKAGR
jgi:hypothetical protein